VYPNVDHKVAGLGNAPDNLIAACTKCNESKNNLVGWTARDAQFAEEWDGLVGASRRLLELVGEPPSRTSEEWMRGLGV
jgi:hypothetical protein